MKKLTSLLLVFCVAVLYSNSVWAENIAFTDLEPHVAAGIAKSQLVEQDAHGTPLVIKLARDGKIKALEQLANNAANGDFLNTLDKFNNNLFHVAQNAATVNYVAALFRQFYGAKAPQLIEKMINQRNSFGETPLLSQINAGHTDTFRSLYPYSTLKQKNSDAKNRLARLKGSDPRIFAQHKDIYCKDIRKLGSDGNGYNLFQAAKAQIKYHPEMETLAQDIGRILPCLVD